MRVGVVFSQADTGADPDAIREWARTAEAVELGFTDLSIGYNRLANPGQLHTAHLDAAVAVKAEVDGMVGRP